MWKLLTDLAVVYCSAASWEVASGDLRGAWDLVRQAEACLDQRRQQGEGDPPPEWLLLGN